MNIVSPSCSHSAAAQPLALDESLLRLLLENAADGIEIVSREGIFRFISPATERMLGYSSAELVGQSVAFILHPDDMAVVSSRLDEVAQEEGHSAIFECRLRRKDGLWRSFEIGVRLLPSGDIVGNSRDITDRRGAEANLRASEEQFRSLIENSSDGIVIFDRQGTVRYVSPGLTRIVGWEAPELLGQTWHALAHPDDLTPTRAMFHQVFEHPGQAIVHESRFRHKDGSWRLLEVVGKLHPNGHVVANSRDITERKLAEEQLRESEERFRAFVEVSPIGIVLVNAEGAIRYASPAYARFSGYEPEDLVGQSFLSLVHPDEMSRVASLFAEVLQHPDRIIVAEYQHLHKDGVLRIAEATGKVLPNGDIVGFVRDITEHKQLEEQLRESEAYYRTILETATDGISLTGASGVFTYVNPAYAQMLGYEPQELIGQPYLPLLHPDEANASVRAFAEAIANPGQRLPPRAPATASTPNQLATWLPLRILLAEDVAVNQKFALLALEDLGYSADVAANGREVLAALQRQVYDVILMDVQMPEMDGLEATRRIRREFASERQPHIIAMTANAMQGDRELCLDAGMDDYVSKPVYLDELRAALERVGQRAEVLEPTLLDQAMVAQVLRQRIGHELIALYIAEAEQLLAELASAVALADLAGAQRLAHGLKSSSRYVGASGMAELSQELEALARDGALAQAPPMAKELQRVFERTRERLLSQSRVQ